MLNHDSENNLKWKASYYWWSKLRKHVFSCRLWGRAWWNTCRPKNWIPSKYCGFFLFTYLKIFWFTFKNVKRLLVFKKCGIIGFLVLNKWFFLVGCTGDTLLGGEENLLLWEEGALQNYLQSKVTKEATCLS